ncbi:hypothetical protein XENOCAPTIV_019823 [Xenoophorus captivus]|uniref:Prolactin receptor n=1 Tax=Xenoophorus captivus TaxID=1517983 RepID=A0ABV0RRF2_9TELE
MTLTEECKCGEVPREDGAGALDSRFHKLNFLPSDDILKGRVKGQALSLQAKTEGCEQEKLHHQAGVVEQDDSASTQPQVLHKTSSMLDMFGSNSWEHNSNEEHHDVKREMVMNYVLLLNNA